MKSKNKKKTKTSSFKKIFFFGFYCMISNNICNTWMYMIIIFLEFFQMAPFVLGNGLATIQLGNLDQNANYGQFLKICLTILGTMFDLQADLYTMAIFSASSLIFILVMLLIVFLLSETIIDNKKAQINSGIISIYFKFAGFAILLVNTILAPLLYGFCADIFDCINDNGVLVFKPQPSIICYTPFHVGMIVLLSIIFIFLLVLINIFDTLYTDSAPHSTIPWAVSSTIRLTTWKQLFKLSFFIFSLYDPNGIFYIPEFLFWALLQGFMLYIIITNPPFLNNLVGGFNIIIQGTMFAFILLMFCAVITRVEPEILITLIIFIFSIIIGILFFFIKKNIDNFYLNKDIMETKEEREICYIIYLYFDLIDKALADNEEAIVKLFGIYLQHQISCSKIECFCKHNFLNPIILEAEESIVIQEEMHHNLEEEKINQKKRIKDKIQCVMNWIQVSLYQHISTHPKSFILRLMNSFYSKEYCLNMQKSMYDILFAQEILKSNMKDDFIIYRFKKNAQKAQLNLLEKHSSLPDIHKVVEFQIESQKCKKLMRKVTEEISQFWILITSKDFNYTKIFNICNKISIKIDKINKLYNICLQLFPRNFKLISERRDFEKFVSNNTMLSDQLDLKVSLLQSELNEQMKIINYDDPIEQCSISLTSVGIISGNPQQIGRIINVNRQFEIQLYYQSKNIIGQNVSILLPSYLENKHNKIIESYINDGGKTINIERALRLIKDGKGYFTFINLTIVLKPDFDEGMHFVCLFRKIHNGRYVFPSCPYEIGFKHWGFFACTSDGNIKGISFMLSKKIGVPSILFDSSSSDTINLNIKDFLITVDDPINARDIEEKGIITTLTNKNVLDLVSIEKIGKEAMEILKKKNSTFKIFVLRRPKEIKIIQYDIILFWILFGKFENIETINLMKNNFLHIKESNNNNNKNNQEHITKEIMEEDSNSMSQSVSSASSISSGEIFKRRIKKFKESEDLGESSGILVTIKRIIDITILLITIFEILFFVFFWRSLSIFSSYINNIKLENDRIIELSNLCLSINLLDNINQTSSNSPTINGGDFYYFLSLIALHENSKLSSTETIINQLSAKNEDVINEIENQLIQIIEISSLEVYNSRNLTINQAIFKLLTISYNIAILNYSIMKDKNNYDNVIYLFNTFTINWIQSLYSKVINNEAEYFTLINNKLWNSIYPSLGFVLAISIFIISAFIFLRKKIPNLQKSSNEVLLIFSDLKPEEVNSLYKSCQTFLKIYCIVDNLTKNELSLQNINDEIQDTNKADIIKNDSMNNTILRQKDFKEEEIKVEEIYSQEENKRKDENNQNELLNNKENKKEEIKEIKEKEENVINEDEEYFSKLNKTVHSLIDELSAKKKIIKNNIKNNTTRLTIIIIFLIIFYISYFLSFVIVQVNENILAKENINLVRIHYQRNGNLIHSLIYAILITHNNSAIYYDLLNKHNSKTLSDNDILTEIEAGRLDTPSSEKEKIIQLDSVEFCTHFTNDITSFSTNYIVLKDFYNNYSLQCPSYYNSILSKGMKYSRYHIYKNLEEILKSRGKFNWDTQNYLSSSTLYLFYLKPTEELFQLKILEDCSLHFSAMQLIIISCSIAYFILAFIAYVAFRISIFRSNEKEVFIARGMLRLAPESYLMSIANNKKYSSLLKMMNF